MASDELRRLAQRADHIEALAFSDLYAALPAMLQPRLQLQVRRQGGATLLLAPGLPSSMFNRVIGLGLQCPAEAADLDALVAAYTRHGGSPWWLHWSPVAAPADFTQLLHDRGFTSPSRRSWAKVARGAMPPPQISTDLQIVPATTETLAETTAAITQAFGMPPFMPAWLSALQGRPRWQVYSVLDAGRPVGGGCLFIDGDAAWLGMGAVLESHRRRGGQGALMARRIADAQAAGCSHSFTETGEPVGDEPNPSLANMLRCGFVSVASRLNFEAPRT